MRLLAMLGVIQTACLLLLIFLQLTARDASPGRLPHPQGDVAASAQALPPGEALLDETLLRRVIRDELAAQAHLASRHTSPTPTPRNALEDQLQRERVGLQLDYYKRSGRISSVQMDALQVEMAKLGPADRKVMLGNLVRAINRGEIDGRF